MKRSVPTAEESIFFGGGHRHCWPSPRIYASSQTDGSLEQRGRIVVFVDALSLYYGELRLQINVDYGLLLQYLAREGRLVHAFFYTGIDLIEQLASRSSKLGSGHAAQPLSSSGPSSDSSKPAESTNARISAAPKPDTPELNSPKPSAPESSVPHPNTSKPNSPKPNAPKPNAPKPYRPHRRRSPQRPSSPHTSKRIEANRQFLNRLKHQGYRVITKEVQHFPDGSKKLDLDVEIAIDMMKLCESCDRMVLVSGDDTLAYAVKVVGDRGVRSEIVSARDMTSQRLLEVADDYCDLYTIREQIQRL